MNMSVLVENTAIVPGIGHEHGLSLYLETGRHKILFDTGASGLFLENAKKMGIDVSQVEFTVLSHGHYDHGGGLYDLLHCNERAPVYISPYAFREYCSRRDSGEMGYIGLDIQFAFHSRLRMVNGQEVLDENTILFSNVKGDYPRPSGNERLFVKTENGYELDDFLHEQNLIIREGNKLTLVAGCAHNGIVNIVEHCRAITGAYPTTVVGGFHLFNHRTKESEPCEKVQKLAERLMATGAKFYTGHCTGPVAFAQLRDMMGDKIECLSAGQKLTL